MSPAGTATRSCDWRSCCWNWSDCCWRWINSRCTFASCADAGAAVTKTRIASKRISGWRQQLQAQFLEPAAFRGRQSRRVEAIALVQLERFAELVVLFRRDSQGNALQPRRVGFARRTRLERTFHRVELRVLAGIAGPCGGGALLAVHALVAEQAPAEDQGKHHQHAIPGFVRLEFLPHGPAKTEPAREVGDALPERR